MSVFSAGLNIIQYPYPNIKPDNNLAFYFGEKHKSDIFNANSVPCLTRYSTLKKCFLTLGKGYFVKNVDMVMIPTCFHWIHFSITAGNEYERHFTLLWSLLPGLYYGIPPVMPKDRDVKRGCLGVLFGRT